MEAAAIAQLKKRLLANPQRIDPRQAAIRVIARRQSCTPAEAKESLKRIGSAEAVARLFQEVLPNEYAAAIAKCKGSRILVADKFIPALGFPLYTDFLFEQIGREEHRHAGIPIQSLAFHACPNCFDFHAMTVPYQLAILLMREDESDYVFFDDESEERYREEKEEQWNYFSQKYHLDDRLRPTGHADRQILENVLSWETTPLRFLVQLTRVISYSTGSVFLDFDPDDEPPELQWTRGGVEGLRNEYKLALEIIDQLERLEKWLANDLEPRLRRAFRVYEQARRLTNAKEPKRAQGRALVRVL